MSKNYLGLLMLFIFASGSFAQKKNNDFNYYIKKVDSKLKIDGKSDDAAWTTAQTATDFFQVLPMDTSMAKVKTDVKFCYDDKNLYVLFINYNYIKGSNMVESMKRDWNFGKNDNDLLFIDTFNDLTTGFSFGSNARGGQWDGLMSGGSSINLSWDNKWQSEVAFDENQWTWEAAIPFKTLRYKENTTVWGINFSRLDLKTTEKSSWTPIPRQFPTASLAFTGNLVWDTPPPSPGANISVIPFITTGISKNHEAKTDAKGEFGAGFDAKFGLTSSLNLDLTVLPDFSQVEVDVQQTNLDRFELFFPERRQFFIENGDIFNNFGSASLRPFFSRRVGLDAPIYYGSKVSGKLNDNWRIGGMNMLTGKNSDGVAGSNYTVLSTQRKIFKRSYIGAIYVDRETTLRKNHDSTNKLADFNRTFGLEYYLASADNKWLGKAFLFKTFSPEIKGQNNVASLTVSRTTKKFILSGTMESVDMDVKANEVGFVRRNNYIHIRPEAAYLFFPKGGKILSHGPNVMLSYYFSQDKFDKNENTNVIFYKFNLRTQATFTVWTAADFVKLTGKFDPTGYKKLYLDSDQVHTWKSWGTMFTSKPQSVFTYGFETRYGGYYAEGKRLRLDAEVAYRFQPYVSIALKSNFNQLSFEQDKRLPEALKNTTHNLWLLGPRLDVTLSNKMFFTNFMQYNNQTNNFNINTRFQWRYSPASDLYLVYTDNYFADTFAPKNRAIVLKFTYWWNV
ncbi:MAG: hydrolase [Cytophagaceae bacterium BCCC1]|nr:MAG: hydrolase [Cytophagaceae bacterium BCCC1]